MGTQAYQLGDWVVDPGRRRLRCGDTVRTLEPKSMAVLQCLTAAAGQTVTRDALVDAVWAGRFVSDDAVNRQLSKLRQALGDDPRAPRYIETIPKTGVRLLVTPQPQAHRHRRRWPWVAAAGAGTAALLAAGWAWWPVAQPPLQGARLSQLTAAPGFELHPAPSPSGRQVAMTVRAPDATHWQLAVLDVARGRRQTLVSVPGADAIHPAWSPDGEQIAYLLSSGTDCTVRVSGLLPGSDRRVAACQDGALSGGVTWSPDSRHLVFSQRLPSGQFGLFRVPVDGGTAVPVLAPAPASNGDFQPRLSAGGTLAFVRQSNPGIEDIWLLHPGAEQPERLSHESARIRGLDWWGDALVVASARADGNLGLWSLDPGRGAWTALSPQQDVGNPRAAADRALLAFEQRIDRVDLWQVPLDGAAATPLLTSTRRDWAPAVSPDGQRLVFLSNRTGPAEVWLSDPIGAEPRPISRFGGPWTQPPVWTPDGAAVLVSAPTDGRYGLWRLDPGADTPVARPVDTGGDASSPVFLPDGRLLFQRGRDKTSDLVDLEGQVVLANIRRAVVGPDGTLYYCRPNQDGLWRHVPEGQDTLVTTALKAGDWRHWWVDAAGVHLVVRGGANDVARLVLLQEARRSVVANLPRLVSGGGVVRADSALVYARRIHHGADLAALRTD